ncbi:MAG: carbamoyltransferase HypF, partial [Nitrospirae bacterium]|nr:carbamoyltransferase HypF [Nitrospirota bacterium]
QHHHAHVAACMAEHHLEGEVLGVAWDGTGYGPDGTLWGGEFLICNGPSYRRLAHLRPFRLPGGDAAVREPRRSALGLLMEAGLPLDDPALSFSLREREILERMIRREVNAPVAAGMGRLFDGVAALLGLRKKNAFEGQAAMALEHLTVGEEDPLVDKVQSGGYPIPLREGEPWTADWSPLLRAILKDRDRGVPLPRIASHFHHALPRVVLSGGCFQNTLLTALALHRLRKEGFEAYSPRQTPPNDGGISLGQIWVGGLPTQ